MSLIVLLRCVLYVQNKVVNTSTEKRDLHLHKIHSIYANRFSIIYIRIACKYFNLLLIWQFTFVTKINITFTKFGVFKECSRLGL